MKSLQVECQTEKVESYENFESTKLATMADPHGETPEKLPTSQQKDSTKV